MKPGEVYAFCLFYGTVALLLLVDALNSKPSKKSDDDE